MQRSVPVHRGFSILHFLFSLAYDSLPPPPQKDIQGRQVQHTPRLRHAEPLNGISLFQLLRCR